MVSLDEDKCLELSQILRAFNAALNEEQCWAICHQSIACFAHFFDHHSSCLISDPKFLFLTRDGNVHPKSLTHDSEKRLKSVTKNKLLSSLGVILFRALDFGLCEEEERSLSRPLEVLIESLTQSDPQEDKDEGIERDCDHCFEDIQEKCISRLSSRESAESHYRAVCRALVAETLELSTFLAQICRGSQEVKQNEEQESLQSLEFSDWARLWVQVIRQLRNGVKLRKVEPELEQSSSLEYELTPFEMLLDDIRLKRYKLNKVLENGSLPPRAKKDAHELILDFIRSRPPLHPVAERRLRAPPVQHMSLYERLMQSIRDGNQLKPLARSQHNLDQSEPQSGNNQISTNCLSALPVSPAPRRRLIKADLNLKLEEEEEDKPQESHRKSQFSLKLLERRHSISVCESPDNSCDTRHHVESIWQSHDWGHALHCLSLTLQEVQHIRSVLTKAELETLAVTKELREDLELGRICFTCLKTRFSFFQRANKCKLCERHICDRCATRMHIPCETFEKVPIYMLSPSPSPPDEKKTSKDWSESRKRSPLMRLMTRDSDCIVVDSTHRKSGPLVRVCRDCKLLVRHLIDIGSVTTY